MTDFFWNFIYHPIGGTKARESSHHHDQKSFFKVAFFLYIFFYKVKCSIEENQDYGLYSNNFFSYRSTFFKLLEHNLERIKLMEIMDTITRSMVLMLLECIPILRVGIYKMRAKNKFSSLTRTIFFLKSSYL